MNIRSLKLIDRDFGDQWFREVNDKWLYDDFKRSPAWMNDWISMDCAVYNPDDDRVYLGITCFNERGIFKAYDRRAGKFMDLGYARVAAPYDAKFHRSLIRHSDGTIYAAIALLHCPDHYFDAPGGAIVHYEPATDKIEKIGIPLPHVYIQSLAIDEKRQTAYCQCFAPESLAAYDLRARKGRMLAMIDGMGFTQGENIVIDDAGCVWCNWTLTRAWQSSPGPDAARLCKYDPGRDKMIYFQKGLPDQKKANAFAKAEAFFNFNDGWIYASGTNGSFFRIDPESGAATFLFTPTPDRPSRLSSLVKVNDDLAYGITGRDGKCELLAVHYRKGAFEKLGGIKDKEGNSLWQCHDIVMTPDGALYICENDNPRRSGYLWEVKV